MFSVRLIGPGRAGRAMAAALADAGCDVRGLLGRGEDVTGAAEGVDVLLLCTPDRALAEVAASVRPAAGTVVAHLSGASGLGVLAPHPRRASLHPLAPIPSAEVGRVRLRSGVTFAVAGDPVARELVALLGGRAVEVDDAERTAYHAAACVASNHLVALMGQVERIAASTGLGLDPFLGLARSALADVADLGPARALTGPAARRDEETLDRHRAVVGPEERPLYDAGVALARRLAGQAPAGPVVPDRGGAPGHRTGRPRVVRSASAFAAALDAARAEGRSVGLVPTMGALHAGHQALVARAAAECDVVAATVFVNPLQFDDPADLAAYHRDLPADLALAGEAGADLVFAPGVEEMYPGFPSPPATTVHVAGVTEVLEGRSRPGHFDGVATVVTKLFALAGRCRAYFGEKDFQQLAVVRRLAADLSLPVEVVGCPTVREPDGLALSSRNVRLGPEGRGAALALRGSLDAGLAALAAGERCPGAVRAAMEAVLESAPLVTPDYAEVVDAGTLRVPEVLAGEVRLLVAAVVEGVRLIDNDGTTVAAPAGGSGAGGDEPRQLVLTTREER
ncbi:MAG: pantoate--beta-alanine ligase [Acidobacteriota bacterium]|nr:pantoate--beta-alanine ligase [Acidobacteriota bacterium]